MEQADCYTNADDFIYNPSYKQELFGQICCLENVLPYRRKLGGKPNLLHGPLLRLEMVKAHLLNEGPYFFLGSVFILT